MRLRRRTKFVSLSTLVVVAALSLCCDSRISKQMRQIVVLQGCDDIEVLSDIERSIAGLRKYALRNEIEVQTRTDTTDCGYLLVNGPRRKSIESVQTDVDLLEIIEEFFGE